MRTVSTALKATEGGVLYWIWSLVYDLASLSLIIFALSGIDLWLDSRPRRWLDYECLGLSFGFSGVMVHYLLLAR